MSIQLLILFFIAIGLCSIYYFYRKVDTEEINTKNKSKDKVMYFIEEKRSIKWSGMGAALMIVALFLFFTNFNLIVMLFLFTGIAICFSQAYQRHERAIYFAKLDRMNNF